MKHCFLVAFLCAAATAAPAQNLSIRMLASGSGWVAADNRLFLTTSAGLQWSDITPPDSQALYGAFFLDVQNGWVLRSTAGTLETARTSDSGRTWSGSPFPLSAEDADVFGGSAAIDFVDTNHGWAMLRQTSGRNFSIGMLFATGDGGATWIKLPRPPLGDPVRFVTQTDGWLAGGPRGDQLYLTRDGGGTWSPVRFPPPPQADPDTTLRYSLPHFETTRDGTITVSHTRAGTPAVALYTTHDGGATWSADAVLSAPSAQHAAVVEAGRTLMPVTAAANIIGADFVSGTEGWIVTSDGYCAGYKTGCVQQERVLATSDGGTTFEDITPALVETVSVGTGEGFDACDPTTAGLATWFTDSPYHYVNVYIGGYNAACPQPGLSKSWISTVAGQGWGLIPTWVGPQAPHPCTSCTGCSSYSSNATTAATQGMNQAKSAAAKMASIGLSGTIVYYDLEYYSESSSCSAATKAFLNAWVSELHSLGYTAGVYGSPSNASADWTSLTNQPDDVWLALWNDVASVWNLSPLSNSYWPNNQRIHQYWCCPTQTYGGVSYNIDQDYLDGAVGK